MEYLSNQKAKEYGAEIIPIEKNVGGVLRYKTVEYLIFSFHELN